MLDPGQRQRQRGTLALHATHKLGDERRRHWRVGACHVGGQQDQAFRIGLRHHDHLVNPGVGLIALDPACRDTHRHPSQIFNQRQPQHDGNRPQFAQIERRDGLIRRHEAAESGFVDTAIAVRHGFQRDGVDARQPTGTAMRQARQFAAIGFGQMLFGGTYLSFDQIEIVEQPFSGWGNATLDRNRFSQQIAHADQDRFIG